jgi:hypothetical protein
MYGLAKIHKESVPLRPIVSSAGSALQRPAQFLARYFQPYAEEANSYVRNAEHFLKLLHDVKIEPGHLLVSFDVVSLFTKIPVDETLDIIRSKINPPDTIMDLTEHCLNNTYFTFEGQMFKQVQGAPMGSPLSPVIANLFMTSLEERALTEAPLKPTLWLRYVDDTFVIWQHGRHELDIFLQHLNKMHVDIKFTMEVEVEDRLPFLDVLILKKPDGSLGHTVYRKATHTNRYLRADSHHHPSQLSSVANTLAVRSLRLADQEHVNGEMKGLRDALAANGYSNYTISKAFNRKAYRDEESTKEKEKPRATAYLPYVRGTTDRISRILKPHNISTIFSTDRKISSMLKSLKDVTHNEAHGIYEVPCGSCEKTYVGRTNRKISARIDEHRVSVKSRDSSSALPLHVLTEGHWIDFDKAKTLVRLNHERPRIYREAIEIDKRPHCINTRDDAIRLPKAWKPLLSSCQVLPVAPQTTSVEPLTMRIDKRRKNVTGTVNLRLDRRLLRSNSDDVSSSMNHPIVTSNVQPQLAREQDTTHTSLAHESTVQTRYCTRSKTLATTATSTQPHSDK